jgi:hypothetical protein
MRTYPPLWMSAWHLGIRSGIFAAGAHALGHRAIKKQHSEDALGCVPVGRQDVKIRIGRLSGTRHRARHTQAHLQFLPGRDGQRTSSGLVVDSRFDMVGLSQFSCDGLAGSRRWPQ